MSELKARITEDMKAALKGGDKPRLATIRLILAALKQREVDERITLDDAQVLHVLEKMLKQRRDSVAQYEAAKREDLADQERYEIGVIEGYLPAQLTDAELDALIGRCIADAGATSPRDMGKVMGLLKERAAGRADMGALSQRVKAKLAG
ncbi:MAG: GatB/YqeY domain-containing protein [Rhodanobacteraceae bacterium]|nr:MAG: GatB/YqeY domain-containing protein [Rhodanobacteraceae bacterium]